MRQECLNGCTHLTLSHFSIRLSFLHTHTHSVSLSLPLSVRRDQQSERLCAGHAGVADTGENDRGDPFDARNVA